MPAFRPDVNAFRVCSAVPPFLIPFSGGKKNPRISRPSISNGRLIGDLFKKRNWKPGYKASTERTASSFTRIAGRISGSQLSTGQLP